MPSSTATARVTSSEAASTQLDKSRARVPRLGRHAAAYALLLAAITAWLPLASSLGTDDGAYGGQVHALQQGDWVLDRPLPVVAEENEGWFNSAITPDGPLPYSSNPSYAILLTATADAAAAVAEAAGGETEPTAAGNALALQSIPVVGAFAAACVAWLLAAHWRQRAAPLAFWLLALGPVIVNATSLWAHTLSTALAGAAVLASVKLLDGPPSSSRLRQAILLFAFTTALVAAAAVRTESALWIASFCGTLVVVRRGRTAWLAVVIGGGSAAVAWAANRAWGLAIRADRLPIVTDVETLRGSPGWLRSRLPAAWELLLTTVRPGPGPVLILLALILVVFAAVRLRHGESPGASVGSSDDGGDRRTARFAGAVLLAACVPYGLVVLVAPGLLLAGTITAWPVVFVLIVAGPGFRHAGATEEAGMRLLLGSSAAFTALVVLTQYASSGGLQWGGRYLSMAFVPVAVAAAIGGEQLFRHQRLPLTALLVAPAIVGIVASHELHETHSDVVAEVTAIPSDVVVTDVRPLPRLAWPALPTAFYFAEPDTAEQLLADLAGAGVDSVNVFGLASVDVDGIAGYRVIAETERVRHLELSETASPHRAGSD
ncbi:MAG: hypothetical protein OEV40_04625 [Acidimicrobiia bacterium]|nr:hypothetical protein [Acidimicrobiia bacterium]